MNEWINDSQMNWNSINMIINQFNLIWIEFDELLYIAKLFNELKCVKGNDFQWFSMIFNDFQWIKCINNSQMIGQM